MDISNHYRSKAGRVHRALTHHMGTPAANGTHVMPKNLTIILLPSRSPELNPVENIWQYLRANWLSNRVFETYDDILDAGCEAWNNLIDQPATINSIGMRKWAHTGQP